MYNSFLLLILLSDVFGLGPALAFFIMTWDNIIKIFISPWTGAKSDKTWSLVLLTNAIPGGSPSAFDTTLFSVAGVVVIGIFGTLLLNLNLPAVVKYLILIVSTYVGSNLIVSGYRYLAQGLRSSRKSLPSRTAGAV